MGVYYVNNDLERKLEEPKRWKRDLKIRMLIGKDFIAKTEKNGGRIEGLSEEEEIEKKQKWKDSKVNREGRRLCEFLKKQEWAIINGNMKTDDEGE